MLSRSCTLAGVLLTASTAFAQAPDWKQIETEALSTLQAYVRIDTSNPPGDVTKAADFLVDLLKREGIEVKRYESSAGRSIVLARLTGSGSGAKPLLLEHHMDVVAVDRSRWARDPFGADIADGKLWGRGSMDMKGIGVTQVYAFLLLHRLKVPLARDVILMAVPDEEVGGGLGARWMLKNHYDELDPEYVLDEGGLGSRDMFTPGKLVFGISVAEKKIMWLRLRAEGVAGHGSQPHPMNPNDHLMRALNRLLSEPMPSARFSIIDTMTERVGTLADNKFNNAIQQSTISVTSLRSGVGEPPRANVIPSVAEATLDCRLLPGTTAAQWLQELERRFADPTIKIEVIYESEDPVVTPQDTPFYRALESAVKRHHPDAIVTPMIVPYGTDANIYRPRGVKSYGFFPGIAPTAAIVSMHGDAEFIPTDAILPAIQILYDALRETVAK
jgi:acetylornithine deacetylase/succinyl-diaminopimelate desuccinylase-like protein